MTSDAGCTADELAAVGQLLLAWGVSPEQLMLEPLLTPHTDHFGGPLFQVSQYLTRADST
jgi:hypothetical protein